MRYFQSKYTYYNKQYKIYKIVKGVGIHNVIHDVHPSFQSNNLQKNRREIKRNAVRWKIQVNIILSLAQHNSSLRGLAHISNCADGWWLKH